MLLPRIWEGMVAGKMRRTILFPDKHGCPGELEAREAAEISREAELMVKQEQEYKDRLRRAGLVGWLGLATFENFIQRDNWAGATERKERVLAYSTRLIDSSVGECNWLILYGGYGTGKSHLAAAAIRSVIDANWSRVYFRVWTDYLARLQATWKETNDPEQETEADIINEMQAGELVVIDDLDKRKPTDWTRSTLFSVLNYRYNAGLPTILTFNYGPDDLDPKAPGRLALEDYLGRAVLDRVIGRAFDVIEFNGPSFRSGAEWSGAAVKMQRVAK